MRAQADDLADQTKVAQPVSHPLPMQQVISVWVRDPRMQKNDFWHAYLDYEICLHTNSLSFTRKISSVRRRYSEFVWLRQTLQRNSLLMVKLPELPPKNPFFSLNNARQIAERMKGLQKFLELTFRSPLLLSDSCLHLFLQSDLSIDQMEACAAGRTHYTVEQVVLRCGRALQRFHSLDDQQQNQPENHNTSCGSDSGCPVILESSSVVAEGAETSVVLDFAPQSDREEETC